MWFGFPFVCRAWEVFGGQYGSGGDCEVLVIGHWEVGLSEFSLASSSILIYSGMPSAWM